MNVFRMGWVDAVFVLFFIAIIVISVGAIVLSTHTGYADSIVCPGFVEEAVRVVSAGDLFSVYYPDGRVVQVSNVGCIVRYGG